jgi:hypothetical protein
VPNLIEQRIKDTQAQHGGQLEVLDAGCGTGLCGPFQRRCSAPAGVDLSPACWPSRAPNCTTIDRSGARKLPEGVVWRLRPGCRCRHAGLFWRPAKYCAASRTL